MVHVFGMLAALGLLVGLAACDAGGMGDTTTVQEDTTSMGGMQDTLGENIESMEDG